MGPLSIQSVTAQPNRGLGGNPALRPNSSALFFTGSALVIGVLSVFFAACGGPEEQPKSSGERTSFSETRLPNILLITLDTTRQDHLGLYGYPLPTSPNLDRLAQDALVYTQAYSTSSWTMPAHASLFTGKFPSSHGAQYDPNGPLVLSDGISGPESWDALRTRGIAVNEITLAMLLQEKGYDTGAIVAGPWLKRIFGLDKGFAHFDDNDIDTVNGRTAESVTEAAVSWINQFVNQTANQDKETPFFLFLNYFDPHGPYAPPPEFVPLFLSKEDVSQEADPRSSHQMEINAYYDAEIRYMDHHLGQLFRFLEEAHLYQDTWIIITADHGELLGERGLTGHGDYLTQEEIRIPMIVKYPKGTGEKGTSPKNIQLTDVLPMIAHALDLPLPTEIQGQAPWELTHPIVAEVYPLPHNSGGDSQVLIEGRYKFVWSSKQDPQLYDLSAQQPEAINLIEQEGSTAQSLWAKLRAYQDSWSKPGPAAEGGTIDAETLEALKNLGYVEQ